MMAGLALRLQGSGLGLPAFAVKYGGSILWGTTWDIIAYGVGILPGALLDSLVVAKFRDRKAAHSAS
jgi:hypothetical protein